MQFIQSTFGVILLKELKQRLFSRSAVVGDGSRSGRNSAKRCSVEKATWLQWLPQLQIRHHVPCLRLWFLLFSARILSQLILIIFTFHQLPWISILILFFLNDIIFKFFNPIYQNGVLVFDCDVLYLWMKLNYLVSTTKVFQWNYVNWVFHKTYHTPFNEVLLYI